jgi:adenylyltransferase/sulfurtransferase
LTGLTGLNPDRLRQATVLVAGVGNIGSPLATFVARTGVGRLRLVDRDRVEAKNLATQDYQPADVGRFKAEVLANRLRSHFPETTIEAHAADLEDLPWSYCRADLILGALDSRRARQMLISEIAWPLGVPVVDGGVGEGLKGRVQVFVPGPTAACLECTWGREDYRQAAVEYPCLPGSRGTAPPSFVPAFAGAVVAGVMTAEAVRLLGGAGSVESQEIAFDLFHRRFLVTRLRRAPQCRFDHAIVTEYLPLGPLVAQATVGQLVRLIESHFGTGPINLEWRRPLSGSPGFEAGRFVALDLLRHRGEEPLEALGLHPGDWIRVRYSQRSAFIVLDHCGHPGGQPLRTR